MRSSPRVCTFIGIAIAFFARVSRRNSRTQQFPRKPHTLFSMGFINSRIATRKAGDLLNLHWKGAEGLGILTRIVGIYSEAVKGRDLLNIPCWDSEKQRRFSKYPHRVKETKGIYQIGKYPLSWYIAKCQQKLSLTQTPRHKWPVLVRIYSARCLWFLGFLWYIQVL